MKKKMKKLAILLAVAVIMSAMTFASGTDADGGTPAEAVQLSETDLSVPVEEAVTIVADDNASSGQAQGDETANEAETPETEPAQQSGSDAAAQQPETGEQPGKSQTGADGLDAGSDIQIRAVHSGEALQLGDQVTLVAELSGYDNTVYELQWQMSKDDVNWTDVPGATDLRYTMTVTEETYYAHWRVLVTVTDILPAE